MSDRPTTATVRQVSRAAPQDNELKGAVCLHSDLPWFIPELSLATKANAFYTLDFEKPMKETLTEICTQHSNEFGVVLPHCEEASEWYSLCIQTSHINTHPSSALFLTQDRLHSLRNTKYFMLDLYVSPHRCASIIVQRLQEAINTLQQTAFHIAIQHLDRLIDDPCFVQPFIEQGGLQLLVQEATTQTLCASTASVLSAVLRLLAHTALCSWHQVPATMVSAVCAHVGGRTKHEDQTVIASCLAILEALLTNSTEHYDLVHDELPFETLLRHLLKSDNHVQQNTLALMNILFVRAEANEQRSIAEFLMGFPVRECIQNSVVQRKHLDAQQNSRSQQPRVLGTDLLHQLGVMQRLVFNVVYEQRAQCSYHNQPEAVEKLYELRSACFSGLGCANTNNTSASPPTSPNLHRKHKTHRLITPEMANEFECLGFADGNNPGSSFVDTPPGLLALDCMHHFVIKSTKDSPAFAKQLVHSYVLSNGQRRRQCPLAVLCVHLCAQLRQALAFEHAPEGHLPFYAMLVRAELDQPFESLFSACMPHVLRLWEDMAATQHDIHKVMAVVGECLSRALPSAQSATLCSFKRELSKYTYAQVQNIWQLERMSKDQAELQSAPVVALRQQLTGSIEQLVREHRLNQLKRGTTFQKWTKGERAQREKGKFWFWCLSTNERDFYYADCADEQKLPERMDENKCRLPVEDIRQVLTGLDCVHKKDRTSKKPMHAAAAFAFSLTMDNADDRFNFVATDQSTFHAWTDGLGALLGQSMKTASSTSQTHMHALLNMELRIRLLHLDHVCLNDVAPVLPDNPPPTFDL